MVPSAFPIHLAENRRRTMEFTNPLWIPCFLRCADAVWKKYREDLEDIALRHPIIFGEYKNFERGNTDFDAIGIHGKKGLYTDKWGCVWQNAAEGLEGVVVGHPLDDWSKLETLHVPDPLTDGDDGYDFTWEEAAETIRKEKAEGGLPGGSGGRFFDRLHFLRGFENLMLDFATDAPELQRLLDLLLDYNMAVVRKWLSLGAESLYFHGDIGTQTSLMISPATFRKFIKPYYMTMFQTCRKAGAHVYYSSDGRLLEIVDDLVECGVTMHDPQVRACTIDGIARAYKGKMMACVDLDRQMFPTCAPQDIRDQVEEVVRKVGSPRGGLGLLAWLTPDVPLETIENIAIAMKDFRTYWWDGRGNGESS